MQQSRGSKKQTLVEEGTELKGTLKSTCQVVVNGSIDGEIEAPSLTVTETGTVLGVVRAAELRSEGTLAGEIDAEDVYLSGTVRSNTMIRAKKLEVKLTPERGKLEVTFGECLIEVGDDPAVKEEPKPELEAVPAEQPAPAPVAAAVPAAASSSEDEEPTWSEPPPRSSRAASTAESDESAEAVQPEEDRDQVDSDPSAAASSESENDTGADMMPPAPSGEGAPRDSQAPPA